MESRTVYIIGDKDYLMHHGIKGQKWGVENGPPYPLDKKEVINDVNSAIKQTSKEVKTIGNRIYDKDVYKRLKITTKEMADISKEYSKLSNDIHSYIGLDNYNISPKFKKIIKKWDNSDGDVDKFINKELPKLKQYQSKVNELNQKNEKLVNNILQDYGNIPLKKVTNWSNINSPVTVSSLYQTKNMGDDRYTILYMESNNNIASMLNSMSEYLWETDDDY